MNIGNSGAGGGAFLGDVVLLRDRVREHIEQGTEAPGNQDGSGIVIKLLTEALATEIICALRYKRHHSMAKGIGARNAAAEFAQHAAADLAHADQLAGRIVQLGGAPDYSPVGLAAGSRSEGAEGKSLGAMIREDLIAERVAIGGYKEIIRYIGDDDPMTRVMLEDILADEEEHAEDLASLIKSKVR
jgi:bacterioferritin